MTPVLALHRKNLLTLGFIALAGELATKAIQLTLYLDDAGPLPTEWIGLNVAALVLLAAGLLLLWRGHEICTVVLLAFGVVTLLGAFRYWWEIKGSTSLVDQPPLLEMLAIASVLIEHSYFALVTLALVLAPSAVAAPAEASRRAAVSVAIMATVIAVGSTGYLIGLQGTNWSWLFNDGSMVLRARQMNLLSQFLAGLSVLAAVALLLARKPAGALMLCAFGGLFVGQCVLWTAYVLLEAIEMAQMGWGLDVSYPAWMAATVSPVCAGLLAFLVGWTMHRNRHATNIGGFEPVMATPAPMPEGTSP